MRQSCIRNVLTWAKFIQTMVLLAVGLLGVVMVQPTRRAYACTPPPPPWPSETTPRDYAPSSSHIFVGHVVTTTADIRHSFVTYTATIQISSTLKGVISSTQVIVDGFGSSSLCKTDVSPGSTMLLFFANGPSVEQLSIVYLLSGPIARAGVFPATEQNINEALIPYRVWLPVAYKP